VKDLIEYVVKTLVDHPDELRIAEIEGERTIVFELRCHPDDVGKVIGKSGKTVGARASVGWGRRPCSNSRVLARILRSEPSTHARISLGEDIMSPG
jgi:predicted RNA-binding protein YlqC (UPF0109 family)